MATMELSKDVTIDTQRCRLMELPMELHICIRDQLLADRDSAFHELRPLRLVCKTFNAIWSPIVMTDMVLFPTDATNDALTQLRYIVHGKNNASTLAAYTTFTIQNLCCVDTEPDLWYTYARNICEQGILVVLICMAKSLIVAMIGSLVYLIAAVITIHPILSGIIYLVGFSVKAVTYTKFAIQKFRARYYMALLPRKLEMRNIRCVRLLLDHSSSDWAIYRSTRILLTFPNLTELELRVADTTDLTYLVRCIKPLKGLHKLTLFAVTISPLRLRCIAALISNNENLIHFDWQPNTPPDFSALFCDIPTTKPLKLQHLSLSHGCTSFDALMPHIRSLTSFEFRSKVNNWWCIYFRQAKIFPSTIKVELLDQELATFISGHPGLVSLTIGSSFVFQGTGERDSSLLCKALTHHSTTLQYLSFNSKILPFILQNVENEANFLQSTCNLREFVLDTEETLQLYQNASLRIYKERRILSVVAHLSHSLIVVIRTRDKAIFSLCVAFCRDSKDFLIRDLAGRIVYERA